MTRLPYYTSEPLTPTALEVLREVKADVFGDRPLVLDPVDFSEDVLVLDSRQIADYPLANVLLEHRFNAAMRHPFGPKTLYLDIETHNQGREYDMSREEFIRLGQYAVGDGDVVLTTDLDEVLDMIHSAPGVVAHNGHPFDFSVLLGDEALDLALENRLFDTFVFANIALPAPVRYVRRDGSVRYLDPNSGKSVEHTMGWLGLDNLCYQLGLPGKSESLVDLARKYNPGVTRRDDLDYGLIPVDDPDFREYARHDIIALRDVTTTLLRIKPIDDYDWREQLNAAIDAQNTRNGIVVDVKVAKARAEYLANRKAELMDELVSKYDFPTSGKKPWASAIGRKAILAILDSYGIHPEDIPDWPTGKTGPSLGGKVLTEFTKGTEAEELGVALAELMGQRTLPQIALDCVKADGKAHPQVSALQRSGRKSTTSPALTIWGSRTESLAVDKEYFVAEPGCVLVEFDYSAADARIVASLSGDTAFKERFAEGVDSHELTGRLVFGNEAYDAEPVRIRHTAKSLGHAYSYRAGPKKLAATAKQDLGVAQQFVNAMAQAYPKVTAWQNAVTKEAQENHFLTNAWGRRMMVDKGKEYTQAPALLGQSGTREIVVDALIRMLKFDKRLILWLKAQIHDALLFSIPEEHVHWAVPKIKELMEVHWGTAQIIHYPVGQGMPAKNWRDASHG